MADGELANRRVAEGGGGSLRLKPTAKLMNPASPGFRLCRHADSPITMKYTRLIPLFALLPAAAAMLSCTANREAFATLTATPGNTIQVTVEPTPTPIATTASESEELIELRRHRELWLERDIDTYTVDIGWSGPAVRWGAKARIVVVAGEATIVGGELPDEAPRTIEQVFDWTEASIRDAGLQTEVSYASHSYPRQAASRHNGPGTVLKKCGPRHVLPLGSG